VGVSATYCKSQVFNDLFFHANGRGLHGLGRAVASCMSILKMRGDLEANMKFQNKIQMLLVGVGAALLMAGSARAQQDMDPTYFDVNPGRPAAENVVLTRAAARPVAAPAEIRGESSMALASSSDQTLEAGVMRMAVVDAGVLLLLVAGLGSIVLYATAATRRESMSGVSSIARVGSVSARYNTASAAIAQ
jgi:hypothetical protein